MSLSYKETKAILHSEKFANLIPDGVTLSQPILSIVDDKIIDNYFVMSVDNGVCNPLYSFGICFDTEELLYKSNYKYVVLPEEKTKQTGLSIDEYLRYQELYKDVREMYSNQKATDQKVVHEYVSLLVKLVPQYLSKVYNDLSPDYFDWLFNNV